MDERDRPRLRVLITNCTMAGRTGTETFVRDVALGLLARGHEPVVYSPHLGPLADELRSATVPVVNDLAQVGARPDVIHGQHVHETMTAMLRFPDVPAAFFVHDWNAWQDTPPRLPRVLRYVAVDETRRDRLVLVHGIPEERVRVITNAVDLGRFGARSPLPERPKTAAVFSNYVRSRQHVRDVARACSLAGMDMTVLGSGFRNPVAQPELTLAGFDIVFALGRSALEAMAVGSSVIVWGLEGLGGLVTPDDFDRMRRVNFGRRALVQAGSAANVAAEIARYHPVDAERVSARVRNEMGLDRFVDAHIALYDDVLAEWETCARPDAVSELIATSEYLASCEPRAAHDLVGARAVRHQRRAQVLVDGLFLAVAVMMIAFASRLAKLALISDRPFLAIETAAVLLVLLLGLEILRRRRRGALGTALGRLTLG